MTTFLESLSWPHTVPLAIVIIVIILRQPLAELLRRLRSVKGAGKKYDVLFDIPAQQPQQALPDPGQTVITKDDVVEAFKAIPDFTEQDVRDNLDAIHANLLRHGVVTKAQLYQLVSSAPILNTIRRLYVDLLLRPRDKTLDPMAVAIWGSALFAYGLKQDLVDEISVRLTRSHEYKQKHQLT
jgi:hypothetical protein